MFLLLLLLCRAVGASTSSVNMFKHKIDIHLTRARYIDIDRLDSG